MLSTNAPSSIQRRRTLHRRQQSTPAAYEAPTVRPLPANQRRQQRPLRSGMSLDLRGLNLETKAMATQGPPSGQMDPSVKMDSFQQEESTVSNTNIGQPQQQFMQVAQSHSQPQPGLQEPFMPSPVQQQSLPSPRTPHRALRAQSPSQPPSSPTKPPTEQQLEELHKHIQSVYGSCGQVFINILPTPTATPQKPVQHMGHVPLETAPMPPNFNAMADINFEPTSSAMTFDFENPDMDIGYESSSYYTSDALSPSPMASPRQKPIQPFLEGIEEHPRQEMAFSQPPLLMPATSTSSMFDHLHQQLLPLSQPSVLADLEVDASLEYTGISAEEVQRYISQQDPATSKWTCLYPECGKVFGRRENIRSHVQTHLGDRQFRCNGCGKCFVRQHDLKRHAKIHTGNKPYKCPCGAGFARQDALTRHRQRGMCVGGFPDAVRKQAKRGRPKKNRPDMEDRLDKATRTRRALASAASSVSAGSPASDFHSASQSPQPYEAYRPAPMQTLLPESSSFDDLSSPADPFSFETTSTPYTTAMNKNESYASTTSYVSDVASLNIIQQLSQATHTPPMSPSNPRPQSSSSSQQVETQEFSPSQESQKEPSTPSQSSCQSNPFTTPPTSPAGPKDDLEELFNVLPENSCSQFDLEMKAMGDFSSLDTSTYEFLDFGV